MGPPLGPTIDGLCVACRRVKPDALLFLCLPRCALRYGGKIKFTNDLVDLVREFTYRCDSVSALRPFVFSAGYTLGCNRFRYSYSIVDKGGQWIVTVD